MSKLEKGQNVTKTTEETAVELDWEMSMDAKLIGILITQKVASAMAEKTKQYGNKIKSWRNVEEIECRESHHQKTVRGAVDAPPRKTKNPRLKRPPSQDHHRNLRLNWHKAERASFRAP